ncbi:MAG: hypothetical protein AAGD96_05315 [Chloroflexota bacterium]
MINLEHRKLRSYLIGVIIFVGLSACQPTVEEPEPVVQVLPTSAAVALVPTELPPVPATWTPAPDLTVDQTELQIGSTPTLGNSTATPLPIPTNTPTASLTPIPTETPAPTQTSEWDWEFDTENLRPWVTYALDEPIPVLAYPRPPNDNGWGMHWMPTVSQENWAVDRFVGEMQKMHIKWVVFLNESSDLKGNEYLVEKLVEAEIMPIMRVYRDSVLPYDGDIGRLVAHYRPRGVYYYQLYNEPNINIENNQGFANPNHYAENWAREARKVVNNGGLPGIGALSPGGEYNHLEFTERMLRAVEFNGDGDLLNRTWISLHNYHGVRAKDDLGGFLMFREYNRITRATIGRSLPIIGTEGGSYSDNPAVVIDLASYQYGFMKEAKETDPYFFAFSWWLVANRAGGGFDKTWEWQALFQPGYTHPGVTEYFYQNSE